MTLLHDPFVCQSIRARIESLSHATPRRWGRMSVGQMLWHCNQVLGTSLGDVRVVPRRAPVPVALLKLLLFNLPMPHDMPTAPEYVADAPREFEAERARCLALVGRFVARDVDAGGWGRGVFAQLTGREWSRLHARHLDHHLRQFGS